MQITYETDTFCILDQFLDSKSHEEVWKYLQAESYSQVNATLFNGAWRLDDGPVMRGPATTLGNIHNIELKYPTGRGVDLIIDSILKNNSVISKWVGTKDKDWTGMSALPMLYPAGTSLYWHRDAENWTGSYTYYAHPEWHAQWGGELFISDLPLDRIPLDHGVFLKPPRKLMGAPQPASFGAHLDNSEASAALMERGLGSFVAPKPNRLVLIKGGAIHSVNKVHASAGDRVRASISGFFQKP